MQVKYLSCFILLLAGIFFLVSGASADERLTIAFVPKSLDNPIFLDTLEAAQKKADELRVNLEWVAPFGTDTKQQINVIENLIKKRVDGIIISANDPQALKEVIDKAVENGIVVATFDSDVPESKRLFYMGTNNTRIGMAMGQALVEVIKNKGIEKDIYETMILSGAPEALNLNKRILGFEEAVRPKLNLAVKDILYCNDDFNLATELVEEYLVEHPETDVIYFVGGWPFYVPPDAMPNFQEWARAGGIAVGIDIFYSALVLQKEGMIDYLIGQDFSAMGAKSLVLMVDYLRGDSKPPVLIETGVEHARMENIDKLLEIHKPWGVK